MQILTYYGAAEVQHALDLMLVGLGEMRLMTYALLIVMSCCASSARTTL
jgi:hypothetical protein